MVTDKSEPAFPVAENGYHEGQGGMSLRQYYAGLAMQGLLAYPDAVGDGTSEDLAKSAVNAADALLKELEK